MRHGFNPQVRKILWKRKEQPIPVFLPRKFHEQRSLVGCSPQDHKELVMTEVYFAVVVVWLLSCV